MTQLPPVPAAKVGDQLNLKVTARPVVALGMIERHDEMQVMGLYPNAKDGARVIFGAGLRRAGTPPTMPLNVLGVALDPAQAVETAAYLVQFARQAATLRGQTIVPTPTPALLDLIVFLAASLPVEDAMNVADQLMDQIRARAEKPSGKTH